MKAVHSKKPPRYGWINAVSLTLLLILVLGVLIVSTGTFDPQPVGQLYRQQTINDKKNVNTEESLIWLSQVAPSSSYSVRISGSRLSGELDMGYGFVIGEQNDHLVIAVSPLGYVSIWRSMEISGLEKTENIVPWRTWPHIGKDQFQNEIWIDVRDDVIMKVWINREHFALEPIPLSGRQIGYWYTSYGQPATIEISNIEIYAEGLD